MEASINVVWLPLALWWKAATGQPQILGLWLRSRRLRTVKNLWERVSFMIGGEAPPQPGVEEGTIDSTNVVAFGGMVTDRSGNPLSGVTVYPRLARTDIGAGIAAHPGEAAIRVCDLASGWLLRADNRWGARVGVALRETWLCECGSSGYRALGG